VNPTTTEPCFVVLRDDGRGDPPTVKLVTWTPEEATRQVDRLNALNGSKGCVYRWETSRALRRD